MSLYVVVSGIILSMAFAPHFALANKCNEVFETESAYELSTPGFFAKGYKQPTDKDLVIEVKIYLPTQNQRSIEFVGDANGKRISIDNLDLVGTLGSSLRIPRTTLSLTESGDTTYTNYQEGYRNTFQIPQSKAQQLISDFNKLLSSESKKSRRSLKALLAKHDLLASEVLRLSPPGDSVFRLSENSILWPKVEIKKPKPWDNKKPYMKTVEYKRDPTSRFTGKVGPIKIEVEPFGKSITVTAYRFTQTGDIIVGRKTSVNQFGHVRIVHYGHETTMFSIRPNYARDVIIGFISSLRNNDPDIFTELTILPATLLNIEDSRSHGGIVN